MEEKIIVTRPPKSPALAGTLAFFFPFGAGAFYNRLYFKGFMYLLIFAGLVTINSTGVGQPFWGLILAGFYFYQIIEAVQDARSFNRRALTGDDTEEEGFQDLPEAIKTGSIFWGAILILLGGIFLLANFDIFDYDIIWEFWPLIIIGIGVKFIYDYFSREKKEA